MLLACTCKHPYQDRKYGKGQRVHNVGKAKVGSGRIARCTACLRVKDLPSK